MSCQKVFLVIFPVTKISCKFPDVLLVHHAIVLVNCPTSAALFLENRHAFVSLIKIVNRFMRKDVLAQFS